MAFGDAFSADKRKKKLDKMEEDALGTKATKPKAPKKPKPKSPSHLVAPKIDSKHITARQKLIDEAAAADRKAIAEMQKRRAAANK